MNVFNEVSLSRKARRTNAGKGRLDLVLQFQEWIRRFPLDRDMIVIGRSGDCDVQVPDTEMSRQHCRLARLPDGTWTVEDLGSSAGTQISGLRITEPTQLTPGTSVELGATRIWLESPAPPAAASSSGQPDDYIDLLLRTIGELYAMEDLKELLRTIVDRAVLIAGGERGALLLANPDGALEAAVARNAQGEDLPLDESVTQSLPKRALALAKPIVLTDTQAPGQLEETPQSVFLGGLRSVLCVPLPGSDGPVGVLYVDARRPANAFGPAELSIFEAMAVHSAFAIERSRLHQERARREREERERLQTENTALKAQLGVADPIGDSASMRAAVALAERVATADATVCLIGETGTGKEVLARYIHAHSSRGRGPFVVVDCGSIPEGLIESELFGHKRGAFSGATESREGRFREADGGTVFIDEVGELPLSLQPRLLRVLQERTVQPLGSGERVAIDVRVICATHRDLARMVKEGQFREDLYYRIAVLTVPIPPLRERGSDVLLLAEHFLARYSAVYGSGALRLTREAREALLAHPWPGNVRELENRTQRSVFLAKPPFVTRADLGLGEDGKVETPTLPTLQEARALSDERFERGYLEDVLRRSGGNVSQAATLAGVSRQLLTRLISRHQIDRLRFVQSSGPEPD